MTRDQAEKIARAVMDEIEQSRMISRDRLTDCIFNAYHKGTVDQYRAAYHRAAYKGDPNYLQVRAMCVQVGLDPDAVMRTPDEAWEFRNQFSRSTIDMQLDD